MKNKHHKDIITPTSITRSALLILMGILLLAGCSRQQDKDNDSTNCDEWHLNLTEHTMWDDPVFEDGDCIEYDKFKRVQASKDTLLAKALKSQTCYDLSYKEYLDIARKLQASRTPYYTMLTANLYQFAFAANDADAGSTCALIYQEFVQAAQGEDAWPQSDFWYIWYYMMDLYTHPQNNEFFYNEIFKSIRFAHDHRMPLGMYYANFLLGLSLSHNGDYSEAFQRLAIADSIANNTFDALLGKKWKDEETASNTLFSYYDLKPEMIRCKIHLGDTLWLRQHIEEFDASTAKIQDMATLRNHLYYLCMYYAWADREAECEDALRRLHAVSDSLKPEDCEYPGSREYLNMVAAIQASRHQQPLKAIEYASKVDNPRERDITNAIKAQSYEQLGDYRMATRLYKEMDSLKAERLNGRNYSQLRTTNELINQENKEMELMRIEMRNQRMQFIIIAILAGCLLAITFIIAYFLHKQKVHNHQLKRALEELRISDRARKQLNSELMAALEQAKKADKAKSHFLQSMTHEISTPLNAINGFVQMLLPSGEDEQFVVDEIRSGSTRLKSLIDTIITLSDYESDTRKLDTQPTSLLMTCLIAIDSCSTHSKPTVKVGLKDEMPDDVEVNINSEALGKLLHCLIENAMKFTQEGSVVLDYQRTGNELIISVTDTGCGIPEADRERVFERFVKLDEFVPGFGLGLPLARTIAHRLGGEVTIDTGHTEGTRMTVRLPV